MRRVDLVAGNGDLLPTLDDRVEPLPRSAVAQLGDVVIPKSDGELLSNPSEYAVPAPVVTLGEGDCAMAFRSNLGVIDKYRYSLLGRLVAPQLSNRRLGTRIRHDGRRSTTLSASTIGLSKYVGVDRMVDAMAELGSWEIIERVPSRHPSTSTCSGPRRAGSEAGTEGRQPRPRVRRQDASGLDPDGAVARRPRLLVAAGSASSNASRCPTSARL